MQVPNRLNPSDPRYQGSQVDGRSNRSRQGFGSRQQRAPSNQRFGGGALGGGSQVNRAPMSRAGRFSRGGEGGGASLFDVMHGTS